MAPQSRKRKSDAVEDTPQPTTPIGSPARKKLKVTASQKQVLIDNLQLEITERARKLRAQYAVQCADLRSRIERRVNRIPTAVRKMTMAELMRKHAVNSKPQATRQPALAAGRDRPLPPLPQEHQSTAASPVRSRPSPAKGKKRKSSPIHIARDDEDDVFVTDTLPIAKKTRTKATAAAPTRTASRAGKPTTVLSPRSHNSRTLPQSPFKQQSPIKSTFSRPMSPLKPASPLKSAASAATSAISASMHGMIESTKRGTAAAAGKLSRTASREKTSPARPTIASTANIRAKMGPPPRPVAMSSPQRSASQTSIHTTTSDSSAMSTGTTVVKTQRATRAAATKAAPATKTRATRAAATTTAATKPTASSAAKGKATGAALKGNARTTSKKVAIAEPAAGRRVLRKRAD